MKYREVTAGERAAIMGDKTYLGLPPSLWDGVIRDWNREKHAQGRRDLIVSVEFAPLFKAICEAGQKEEQ